MPHKGNLESEIKWERWRLDSSTCGWWKVLRHPDCYDEHTRVGKNFRHLFRVPRKIFDTILEAMRKDPRFHERTEWTRKGPKSHPLELKLCAALRILGKGWDFETAEEVAHISEPCLRTFFHKFTAWFVETFYEEEVKWPEGDELDHVRHVYEKLGFPGAIGSVDGVHVPWACAPAGSSWMYKGKEGYPSLALNVTVGPNLKIYHMTPAFGGATNDKTMANWDELIQALKKGTHYQHLTFTLADGTVRKGAWLICDNGYHQWPVLQFPAKYPESDEMAYWSKRLESVRKDAERTFGIIKKRFFILCAPLKWRKKESCENVIKTTAILHNMLLHHDEADTIGKYPQDWVEPGRVTVREMLDRRRIDEQTKHQRDKEPRKQPGLEVGSLTPAGECGGDDESTPDQVLGWRDLRIALVHHFTQVQKKKEVSWLKTRRECRWRQWSAARHKYANDSHERRHNGQEVEDGDEMREQEEREMRRAEMGDPEVDPRLDGDNDSDTDGEGVNDQDFDDEPLAEPPFEREDDGNDSDSVGEDDEF